MSTLEANCLQCEQEFDAPIKELNRGNGRFCSLSCSSRYRQIKKFKELNKPNVSCAQCNKRFYKNKSKQQLSKSGLFFCRRACKDAAQCIGGIKEIMPSHYGTADPHKGYRRIAFKAFSHSCNRCSFHKVPGVLQVHHKDRDRTNCDASNLEILCPTCHMIEHFKAGDGLWASNSN